ncbi:MAG: redox-sensing transcriptional repressor Rex [Bacteroidales bacterium]|nr:redox-sensing transcriptional repressor Rex [Bacteroidales bacterium]
MNLPPRTIERLSKYRRLLKKYPKTEGLYIFSHHLARLLNLTPVQVRRDLMLIGLSGNHRKGYNITELLKVISQTIDTEQGHNLAIVGMGNLGRAVTRFIRKNETRMNIVAGFDIDQSKLNETIEGVPCYHISQIEEYIKVLSVDIAILTTSPESAQEIADRVIRSGVTGILNFTSVHLDVPKEIYLKDYDIITSLEEIGFFIKSPLQ